jgi:hypothetical protein
VLLRTLDNHREFVARVLEGGWVAAGDSEMATGSLFFLLLIPADFGKGEAILEKRDGRVLFGLANLMESNVRGEPPSVATVKAYSERHCFGCVNVQVKRWVADWY